MADWISTREQDLAVIWAATLQDTAKQTAYGWDATECQATAGKITTFLNARTAYEADNSTANRIVKDEAKGEAIDGMRDFDNTSVRF
jgi:hypothetical protein